MIRIFYSSGPMFQADHFIHNRNICFPFLLSIEKVSFARVLHEGRAGGYFLNSIQIKFLYNVKVIFQNKIKISAILL